MKKVIRKLYGYARVSTMQQKEDRQILALKNEGVPIENIYIDKQTGKNFARPMYQDLRQMKSDSWHLILILQKYILLLKTNA